MRNETIEYYHKNNVPVDWDALTIENRDKLIDDIVNKHSYARTVSRGKKDVLDATTANAIKKVKDALNPVNKNKFLSFDLYRIVDITWRLIN